MLVALAQSPGRRGAPPAAPASRFFDRVRPVGAPRLRMRSLGGSTGVAGEHKFIEGYYFLVCFRRVSRLRRPFFLRPRRRAGRAAERQPGAQQPQLAVARVGGMPGGGASCRTSSHGPISVACSAAMAATLCHLAAVATTIGHWAAASFHLARARRIRSALCLRIGGGRRARAR